MEWVFWAMEEAQDMELLVQGMEHQAQDMEHLVQDMELQVQAMEHLVQVSPAQALQVQCQVQVFQVQVFQAQVLQVQCQVQVFLTLCLQLVQLDQAILRFLPMEVQVPVFPIQCPLQLVLAALQFPAITQMDFIPIC